jgi:hypothetical protein
MDKPAPNSAAVRNPVRTLKVTNYPPGTGPKTKRMAQYEAEAARRKWLMISGAIVSALIIGVLIGRFLLP